MGKLTRELPDLFSVWSALRRALRRCGRGLSGLACLSLLVLPITGELLLTYQEVQASAGAGVQGLVWPVAVRIWRVVLAFALAGLASEAAPDEPDPVLRVIGGVLSGLIEALVALLAAVPALVWYSKLGVSLEGASLLSAVLCPALTAAVAGAVSAFRAGALAAMAGLLVAGLLVAVG